MQLESLVDEAKLLSATNQMVSYKKYADIATMVINFKLHGHFDLEALMRELVKVERINSAKQLVSQVPELRLKLIKLLTSKENCKYAAQMIREFGLKTEDFPSV